MVGFVCLSVSIDACAVTSSPEALPPAPPPFLQSLFATQAYSVSQSEPAAVSAPEGLRRLVGPGKRGGILFGVRAVSRNPAGTGLKRHGGCGRGFERLAGKQAPFVLLLWFFHYSDRSRPYALGAF